MDEDKIYDVNGNKIDIPDDLKDNKGEDENE